MVHFYIPSSLQIKAPKGHEFPLMEMLAKLQDVTVLVTEIEACDYVLIPINIQFLFLNGHKAAFQNIKQQTKRLGKNILLFSGSDYGVTFNDPFIHTVRLGGFQSKMKAPTIIMPPFIEDPYIKLKKSFEPIQKPERPTIGFVGHANNGLVKYAKEFALYLRGNILRGLGKDVTDFQNFYPSSRKRYHHLQLLEKKQGIDAHFIYRANYRAGVTTEKEKERTTQEFYENIHSNLYTFCLRGTGNFSVRFYETLAMGRIPVLVDTDCKLPFQSTINWHHHALIIKEKEVKQLPSLLESFHKAHSSKEIKDFQIRNRTLWEKVLQKDGYFSTLIQQLKVK